MADLFASLESAQAGWRLARLEILDWGTFDGPVWVLRPAGLTSLLTGDNGSGKSTVVDALLTLLVPPSKRTYNLASGAEKRRERDEASYVLGAYGQERDETTNRSRTKTHRERGSVRSVLAAVFENDSLKATTTLAQAFWYDGDTLKKLFFVGESDLSVRDDFAGAASPAELRKALRAKGHVADSFRDYQARFERIFGLRSEKALTLLNQTVSLKSIESLTKFVRDHMLEPGDAPEALERLRASHEDLSRSHEAILTARRQQEILDPMASRAADLARAEEARSEDARVEAALPSWLAARRLDLVAREQQALERLREELRNRLEPVERHLEEHRTELGEAERDLAADATGQRLQEIEKRLSVLASERREVEGRRGRLSEILEPLGWVLPESDAERADLLAASAEDLGTLDKERVAKGVERDGIVVERAGIGRELADLRRELDSLRSRRTRIPEREVRLRGAIAQAVGCSEDDLPFAGELLRVREDEVSWEPAIERLLHGFALRLLVPPRLYREVRDHVDSVHLGARLVFHRAEKPRAESRPAPEGAVASKVEIRPGTPHKPWLQAFLAEKFDHLCCETLAEAPPSNWALTRNGLVRGGESLHEKDDRHRIDDRSRWVLGWSNEDKIRALGARMAEVNDRDAALRTRQEILEAELEGIARREKLHERLPELLRTWDALDLPRIGSLQEALESERDDLAAGSDALAALRARVTNLREAVHALEFRQRQLFKEDGALESRVGGLAGDRDRCERHLEVHGSCPGEEGARIEAEVARRKVEPDLEGIEDLGRRLVEWTRKRQQDRRTEIDRHRDAIQGAMGEYLKRFPADSADLGARLEYLDSFLALHRRVVQDDLPRHEARFRELLRDSVVREVNLFRNQLEKEEREIRTHLGILNESLHRIPYTDRTHLQLLATNVADEEVRGFRSELRDCVGDLAADDEVANEARFLRVRNILDRLQHDERWRRKVIDVRNWLEFSATEKMTDSGEEVRHYPDSAGLSGGQKAKLAYTVLASGLAWHFGLEQGEVAARSLRFVVIDEAFSRSDDDSSRFCLDLFRKLDLQLLVVTPSDKIHVVEPFIATCHYVWYDRETDRSQVCDLTLSELHDRRAKARRALRDG